MLPSMACSVVVRVALAEFVRRALVARLADWVVLLPPLPSFFCTRAIDFADWVFQLLGLVAWPLVQLCCRLESWPL